MTNHTVEIEATHNEALRNFAEAQALADKLTSESEKIQRKVLIDDFVPEIDKVLGAGYEVYKQGGRPDEVAVSGSYPEHLKKFLSFSWSHAFFADRMKKVVAKNKELEAQIAECVAINDELTANNQRLLAMLERLTAFSEKLATKLGFNEPAT